MICHIHFLNNINKKNQFSETDMNELSSDWNEYQTIRNETRSRSTSISSPTIEATVLPNNERISIEWWCRKFIILSEITCQTPPSHSIALNQNNAKASYSGQPFELEMDNKCVTNENYLCCMRIKLCTIIAIYPFLFLLDIASLIILRKKVVSWKPFLFHSE